MSKRTRKYTIGTIGLCMLGSAAVAYGATQRPALPEWITADQIVETATVLADGLRASDLARGPASPVVLAVPALVNETAWPVAHSDDLANRLAEAIKVRCGAEFRFVGARLADASASMNRCEIVLIEPERNADRSVTIALRVPSRTGKADRLIASNTIRTRVRLQRRDDSDDETARDDPPAQKQHGRLQTKRTFVSNTERTSDVPAKRRVVKMKSDDGNSDASRSSRGVRMYDPSKTKAAGNAPTSDRIIRMYDPPRPKDWRDRPAVRVYPIDYGEVRFLSEATSEHLRVVAQDIEREGDGEIDAKITFTTNSESKLKAAVAVMLLDDAGRIVREKKVDVMTFRKERDKALKFDADEDVSRILVLIDDARE